MSPTIQNIQLHSKYNTWISGPIRAVGGELITHRYNYIEAFVISGIEPFLKSYGYTLGKNISTFKRKLALFWFYMNEANRKSTYIKYAAPRHRNHAYDSTKFFNIFDNELFPQLLDDWAIEGFLDDSDLGGKIYTEIKYFIYTWIDLENSPAREEIDEILREEEERKRLLERIKKEGYHFLQNKNYEYDVAELGTFRGDRVYT